MANILIVDSNGNYLRDVERSRIYRAGRRPDLEEGENIAVSAVYTLHGVTGKSLVETRNDDRFILPGATVNCGTEHLSLAERIVDGDRTTLDYASAAVSCRSDEMRWTNIDRAEMIPWGSFTAEYAKTDEERFPFYIVMFGFVFNPKKHFKPRETTLQPKRTEIEDARWERPETMFGLFRPVMKYSPEFFPQDVQNEAYKKLVTLSKDISPWYKTLSRRFGNAKRAALG